MLYPIRRRRTQSRNHYRSYHPVMVGQYIVSRRKCCFIYSIDFDGCVTVGRV